MKNKIVYLIRHAESLSNAGMRTTSPAENGLTTLGLQQAQDLALHCNIEPQLICYSTYLRTRLTAMPTIAKYPHAIVEEWQGIHEFTYLDKDRCKNTTPAERLPLVQEYWHRLDPDYNDGGNAESFSQMLSRVRAMLKRLQQVNFETIFVFTHGQFIATTQILLQNPQASDLAIMQQFLAHDKGKTIHNCEMIAIELP